MSALLSYNAQRHYITDPSNTSERYVWRMILHIQGKHWKSTAVLCWTAGMGITLKGLKGSVYRSELRVRALVDCRQGNLAKGIERVRWSEWIDKLSELDSSTCVPKPNKTLPRRLLLWPPTRMFLPPCRPPPRARPPLRRSPTIDSSETKCVPWWKKKLSKACFNACFLRVGLTFPFMHRRKLIMSHSKTLRSLCLVSPILV